MYAGTAILALAKELSSARQRIGGHDIFCAPNGMN